MTPLERARRIAAWVATAETLGKPLTKEQLSGLVDRTARIHVENLKPALDYVVENQPNGFLPILSAVYAASNRLAGERRDRLQKELHARRVAQFQIEAKASPADAQAVQDIVDRIAHNAERAQRRTIRNEKKLPLGWGDKGMAAVRKMQRERGTE